MLPTQHYKTNTAIIITMAFVSNDLAEKCVVFSDAKIVANVIMNILLDYCILTVFPLGVVYSKDYHTRTKGNIG